MLPPVALLEKLFGITKKKAPLRITDESFERDVLGSPLPVLLDVWGPSCGPCKQLEAVIMDLAAFYDGRVNVCELSAAAFPRSAARLKVQHTPTVVFFKDGVELERIHGFRSSLFHKETISELFGIAP
jgi:thioredoxin-like negative regulator of GroEL